MEERFARDAEELKIDEKNKAVASEPLQLFLRMATMLGYASILVFSLVCYTIVLSYPIIADDVYENSNLPKVNKYKEYFLYPMWASFWIYMNFICNSYCNFVSGNGLRSIIKGLRTTLCLFTFSNIVMLSLVTLAFLYAVENGLDITGGEAMYYVLSILSSFFCWVRCLIFMKRKVKKFISEEKKKIIESKKRNKVKVKTKGGFGRISYESFFSVVFTILILVFSCYYVFLIIIIYTSSSTIVKGIICLLIHPLITEVFLTWLHLNLGSTTTISPFFENLICFAPEALMQLVRRFLFNDVNSITVTLFFVFISGLEEILARWGMERKEVALRDFFGMKKLTEIELVAKRRLYSHSVTARSILEMVSIVLAPAMIVCFAVNRFTVDLGYDGLKPVDMNSLFVTTIIQLVVELLVVYICSMIEIKQKVPMSDFFFQFRSSSVFFSHFTAFCAAIHWVIHNLKTLPSSFFCDDVNDLCSCSSFKIYSYLCEEMKLNRTFNLTLELQNSAALDAFNLNTLPFFGSIFGIFCILIISNLVLRVFNHKQRNLKKRNAIEKANKELVIKGILDEVTVNMLENSAISATISSIENLCRGVSPSQAKILQHVIEMLKSQNNVSKNVVDVESILQNSSNDQDVQTWLKDQLMSNNDVVDMKRKQRALEKRLSASDRNRFLMDNNDGSIDLKQRRKSLTNDSQKAYTDVKIDEPEINSFQNIKTPFPLIEIENEEADSTYLDYLSWDFNIFAIKSKNPQSFLAWKCLSKLGLIEELRLPKLQLSNILLYVEQHYTLVDYDLYSAYSEMHFNGFVTILSNNEKVEENKNNPYHNNLHGADVFQAVLYFSTKYQAIGGKFTSFDLFSVLFAAYIHDFNHPGLNSTYVISDWPMSGISSTFGNESPLEKHHLAMAFNLMRNVDEYNFLSSCSSTERDHFRRIVTECVMATDLAKSMPWISTSRVLFSDLGNSNATMNKNNSLSISLDDKMKLEMKRKEIEHKILLMQLAIKCADVGHPSRSLEQHLEWSSRICAEFYSQGDKERNKGMKISPLCDRNMSRANYPQGQIGFINFVSKPCFTLLNEVCLSVNENEKPWLKNLKSNIEYWEEKKRENTIVGEEKDSKSDAKETREISNKKETISVSSRPEILESQIDIIEKEERRIENLNQDQATEVFHLFMRLCTILGYSLILSGTVGFCLIVIGLPQVTDSTFGSIIPKVNIWKLYVVYGFSFLFFCFIFLCTISYCYRIIGNGFFEISGGTGLKFIKNLFAFVLFVFLALSLISAASIFTGIDILASDCVLYIIAIICIVFFWLRFLSNLIEVKKVYEVLRIDEKVEVEVKREARNFSMTNFALGSVGSISKIFFGMYYIFMMIIFFRWCTPIGRVALSLFVHPLVAELVLTAMRFELGTYQDDHPFYDHNENPLAIEFSLNLLRRFMFNSVSIDFTVMLIVISGFQEVFFRSLIEWKEINVRKLFFLKPLNVDKMLQKRKYYSYANTARSILEINCIVLAPMMYVIFSKNRYAVDLGYVGSEEVDIGTTVTSTILQLVVEMMVVYMCSVIEINQNIPMSDFFFQYRSFFTFINHVAAFVTGCAFILHNFKTIPTHLLCSDVNNVCSCPSFNVYQHSVCLNLTSLNTSRSSEANSSNGLSMIILLVVLGVFFVMGIIYFVMYYRSTNAEHLIDKSKLEMENTKIKSLLDATTTRLMEKSTLQQSISSIESLCRGVSPSQAKILQHVIEMLKSQNNVSKNVVDVESILQNSSNDQDVQTWLKDQLMSNNDVVDMKRKQRALEKRLSASDRNRFLIYNNDGSIDMKERRKSLTNNGKKDETANEMDESEINSFPNIKTPFPSIEIENEEADNDSTLNYLSWDFNVFAIKSKNPQSFLAWKSLSKLGLIEELRLLKLQLSNILLYVEQHYTLVDYDLYSAYSEMHFNGFVTILSNNEKVEENKNNPYHNNLHGADVFQAVLYFSTKYEDIGGKFTSFDLFSVLFAAYIHDFNHPGLNSTYVISDWPMSGISSTFGSESPLEKHHLAMAFNLMRNVDEYNFLSSCSSTERDHFRRIVTECVMATDLAQSMPWISTSRVILNDYRNYKVKEEGFSIDDYKRNYDNKILLMQLAIKCADVGHPSRSLDQHLEWSSRICAEFYSQGDKERGKGMKISPLCDRNVSKANYPQGQIGFINFVAKPCFTLLNEVCLSVSEDEKPWLKYMKLNVEYWEGKRKEFDNFVSV